MQMFPDDLPLANIDADGYCCHFMRSSIRPWAWVCVLHTKRLEEMAYNLACWCIQMAYTQHSWMLMDIVVGPSVRLFVYGIFSKVRVGAKEGGSHYWEMAVAITCGYGGYLLPLLAAHSSFFWDSVNWTNDYNVILTSVKLCCNLQNATWSLLLQRAVYSIRQRWMSWVTYGALDFFSMSLFLMKSWCM